MAAGATYEPIATTTLGSAQSSVTFSSLGSYTDIKLVMQFMASDATLDSYAAIQFNSDTATNYSHTILTGNGSAASSTRGTSIAYIDVVLSGTSSTIPALGIVDIFSYGGSTNKTVLCQSSQDQNGAGAVRRIVGLWRSTAAITSIKIYNRVNAQTYATGSTFTLYGIKAA